MNDMVITFFIYFLGIFVFLCMSPYFFRKEVPNDSEIQTPQAIAIWFILIIAACVWPLFLCFLVWNYFDHDNGQRGQL